jgi:hypothetical protein
VVSGSLTNTLGLLVASGATSEEFEKRKVLTTTLELIIPKLDVEG